MSRKRLHFSKLVKRSGSSQMMIPLLWAITFSAAIGWAPAIAQQPTDGLSRAMPTPGFRETKGASGPVRFSLINEADRFEVRHFLRETSPLQQATMLQPTPFLEPRVAVTEDPTAPAASENLSSQLFTDTGTDRSVLRTARLGVSSLRNDYVQGEESGPLVSTDAGSLLRKSDRALSVKTQQRTPIVNDPRVRSSRVGSLAASGSHWVPAREDLDTALSKIDSRLLEDMIIVPGPYSSVYGPGFHFIDFDLLRSPRDAANSGVHGRTSFDHQTNGNRWSAQQSLSAAGPTWGIRGNYSHRLGSDYRAGDGSRVASSYESREFHVALGRDFRNGTSIELSLLRLDQTDVEFPGYVFDIDSLVTDGYDISYIDPDPHYSDRTVTEIWYNRTRFDGDAQSRAKRNQFPFLDRISYSGVTDVDSMSTGYRRASTWGGDLDQGRLIVGHDLRFIKQELNEIASGTTLGIPIPFANRNSPIPRSFLVNPGLFAEYTELFLDEWTFKTGARIDYAQTDIVDDPEKLQEVGLSVFPASYEEIVGTSQSQTDRVMWSLYGSLTRQHCPSLVSSFSLGYAQRPPSLTELYAAQPFLLLLQNGLNNVTGDPGLKREQLLQGDFSVDFDGRNVRAGIRAFYGWAFDYITFENTNVVTGPPNGDVQQVSLRYVNTNLATLAGFESFLELMPNRLITPFATMRYVDGRDRTRNGDFATTNGQRGTPSSRVGGLPRGFFGGLSGGDSEPLPGISPLEARLGVRLKNSRVDPKLNVEFAARVVDNQDRVATSLLESATPGYTVFDLRSTYRPCPDQNLVIVSGVENLTDKTYREHLDFRSPSGFAIFQPGVSFYFGTDWIY